MATTMTTCDLTASIGQDQATALYGEFSKPYLAKLQRLLAIDRVYMKGTGDYLTDADGNEVLDLLGGYGSTLLGHNHPRLVGALCAAYRANVPTHVQGSVREPAARLAERLNSLFSTSMPGAPKYLVHLATTGTEAVEAAIKHALLEYTARRKAWSTSVEKIIVERLDQDQEDASVRALQRWKEVIDREAPVLVAVKRSYHGKTAGSLAATWNPAFKTMFDQAPIRTTFLDADDIAGCEATVAALVHSAPLKELPRFSPIIGVMFEPMQCEGGMFLLPELFIRWLEQLRTDVGVPLIADEIQSGFFRTGRFLCCEHFALQPDYILLGKSLGGGLGKISATCISATRYREEFSWLHSSTFAEDEPSCIVALEAIDEIESLSPSITERAERFESRMRDGVADIQRSVGPFIAEIRGKGFLIGLDFDLAGDEVEIPLFLKTATDAGLGSYLFMSYLLTHHRIRVGVTLSKSTVLRVEPSLYLTAADTDRFLGALREMCELIRDRKLLMLTSHLWRDSFDATALEVRSAPLVRTVAARHREPPRVSFITHVIDLPNVGRMDAALNALGAAERRRFMETFGDVADPVVYHEQEIESAGGERILLELYGVMRLTEYFEQSLRQRNFDALEEVRAAVGLAARRGSTLAGLGQYTSIVSSNGMLVKDYGPAITTGNSLTAGFAFETLRAGLRERAVDLRDCRVGIVGAAGNICNVLAQMVGDHAASLTLVHRGGDDAARRMEQAKDRILRNATVDAARVQITADVEALASCDAIVIGTNTTESLITPEILKANAVIIDISVPSNVDRTVFEQRPDVAAYHGALARLPSGQTLTTDWMPLPRGQVYACLAETITLGLTGRTTHFSMGSLRKQQVLDVLGLAERVGVSMGKLVPLKLRS